MIQTVDLGIGNLITVSEVIYRVSGISETKVRYKEYKESFNQEALEPILLTHELLERASLNSEQRQIFITKCQRKVLYIN